MASYLVFNLLSITITDWYHNVLTTFQVLIKGLFDFFFQSFVLLVGIKVQTTTICIWLYFSNIICNSVELLVRKISHLTKAGDGECKGFNHFRLDL